MGKEIMGVEELIQIELSEKETWEDAIKRGREQRHSDSMMSHYREYLHIKESLLFHLERLKEHDF